MLRFQSAIARLIAAWVTLAVPIAHASNVERPAALDPAAYTIQGVDENPFAPLDTGQGLLIDTYRRFGNADVVPATITIEIVGVPSGVSYASVPIIIAAHGSYQIRDRDLVLKSANISGFQFGDTGFQLYLKSSSARTTTSNANYTSLNNAFTDYTTCSYTSGYDYSWINSVQFWVHTSNVGYYLSNTGVFNPNDFPVDVRRDMYDPNGVFLGSFTTTLSAHSGSFLTGPQIQSAIGYTPGPGVYHMNVFYTVLTPGVTNLLHSHVIIETVPNGGGVVDVRTNCPIEH